MANQKKQSTPPPKRVAPVKTHDAFFKAVGSITEVAQEFIRCAVPEDILQDIELSSLSLATTSYIDENLKDNLSDLVYTSNRIEGELIRICFLFEHKSTKPGRSLILQLLRYLLGILEEDEKQGRQNFSLTIPVVFYHGKEAWIPETLLELYKNLPTNYQKFVPDFHFYAVNLQQMSDEQILGLKDTQLAQNIFLTMKHAWEDNYYRENLHKLVIFDAKNTRLEVLEIIVQLIFQYVYHVSSLNTQVIMEATQALPTQQQDKVRDYWKDMEAYFEERGLARGMEKGMEKGMEIGMEKGMEKGMEIMVIVLQFVHDNPFATDEEITQKFNVPIEVILEIRKLLPTPPG